jgi:hypothetical protein
MLFNAGASRRHPHPKDRGMSSARKDPPQAKLAHETHEDDFDPASLDDLASLLVEALTIPLAADLQEAHEPCADVPKVRYALPPSVKAQH